MPLTGISTKWKRRLDNAIKFQLGTDPAPWVNYDLRRTVVAGLAKLGIAPHVRSAVLNHVTAKGADKHYDRYEYFPEKLAALERWNRKVRTLYRDWDEQNDGMVVVLSAKNRASSPAGVRFAFEGSRRGPFARLRVLPGRNE